MAPSRCASSSAICMRILTATDDGRRRGACRVRLRRNRRSTQRRRHRAEQAAYVQAFEALKSRNYAASIAGFKQYLATYPTSDLADNAQYWLGEAYYVTRDYDNAAVAFRAVGERWPNSRKAPDALLKLGFTQFELKNFADARATLDPGDAALSRHRRGPARC